MDEYGCKRGLKPLAYGFNTGKLSEEIAPKSRLQIGRCGGEGYGEASAGADDARRSWCVMGRLPAASRQDYRWFCDITLRWNDIDVFGHVNNAQYYEFFDTAVVHFLHTQRDARITPGGMSMVVAENGCRFLREIVFTDRLEMGLRVERLGTSSVRYGLAAFINGGAEAVADGHFVHVFLDPATKRPAPLDPTVRRHLETIAIAEEISA